MTVRDGNELASERHIDDAWVSEIDRRSAELDAGTVETIPWETLREKLRRTR